MKRRILAGRLPASIHRALGTSRYQLLELVGLSRFELLTPRLSSVCSNQLSYRPQTSTRATVKDPRMRILSKLDRTCSAQNRVPDRSFQDCQHCLDSADAEPDNDRLNISRKEVIQPQVLLQLPCYDFTPITDHTLGGCLPCGLAHRLLVQPTFVM